jgi:hypothetical protein
MISSLANFGAGKLGGQEARKQSGWDSIHIILSSRFADFPEANNIKLNIDRSYCPKGRCFPAL